MRIPSRLRPPRLRPMRPARRLDLAPAVPVQRQVAAAEPRQPRRRLLPVAMVALAAPVERGGITWASVGPAGVTLLAPLTAPVVPVVVLTVLVEPGELEVQPMVGTRPRQPRLRTEQLAATRQPM